MDDDTSPHPPQNASDSTQQSTLYSSALPLSDLPASEFTGDGVTPTVHAIIRLIQCSRCSQPLRAPLRLPCGNTLCRSCLPPIRERMGVTYPAIEERKKGFLCHWGKDNGCAGEHCLGDCGADVLLGRLVDVFDEVLSNPSARPDAPSAERYGFRVTWTGSKGDQPARLTKSADVGSGLLEGMYDLVKRGSFDHDASDVKYEAYGPMNQDKRLLEKLKEAVQNQLDCQVCYSLILDPLTTPCGHTFCRGCITMVLNQSDLCPACRRKLHMASTVKSDPINKRIADIMETLLPEQIASRRDTDTQETTELDDEKTLPLFVSSLSLPTMPTFLHVFEARYRLMMQRVMQCRERIFGMVMFNRAGRTQQGLGQSRFMQYGTALVVDRYELLPDGRSLVIATGLYRFKVASSYVVDMYYVGRIQRVDDIPVIEEESREAMETSVAANPLSSTANTLGERSLEHMSTQQLFQFGLDFVRKQHSQGAAWLHPRVLLAYGDIPTDPAQFPWWFASVLPVWEEEKYALLPTTSVRERLKITSRWVKKVESREWCDGSPSAIDILCLMTSRPSSRLCSDSSGNGPDCIVHPVVVPKGLDTLYAIYHQPVEVQDSETYVPQTLVVGIFLAIFVAQMAANGFQILRSRRQRRIGNPLNVRIEQEAPRTPAGLQGEGEGRTPEPSRDAG
ncbi:hypothetical protein BBP40_002686 [Aspergillus hancockii]|nr:hypothetical protein BBP40_002686 [Aspergillus hancockii]